MTYRLATREDDEMLLDWLARRDAGQTYREIGSAYGKTADTVRGAIQRVKRHYRASV